MSRKYGQKGYQEDYDRPRGERPKAPRERPEGPRGRGLGAPTATVFRCARCGAKGDPIDPANVLATCRQCGSDLHTCSNCLHFDTSARFECRQPISVRVASKTKRNECSFFAPKTVQEFGSESSRPDDPRAAFDALFKF